MRNPLIFIRKTFGKLENAADCLRQKTHKLFLGNEPTTHNLLSNVEALEERQMLSGVSGFDNDVPLIVANSIESVLRDADQISSGIWIADTNHITAAENLAGSDLSAIDFLDHEQLAEFQPPSTGTDGFSIRMIDVDEIPSHVGLPSQYSHVLFDHSITTTSNSNPNGEPGYQLVASIETIIVGLNLTQSEADLIESSQTFDLTNSNFESRIDISFQSTFTFIENDQSMHNETSKPQRTT